MYITVQNGILCIGILQKDQSLIQCGKMEGRRRQCEGNNLNG